MRRGFTLIEVIVAIALILALSASVFSFGWGMLDRREQFLSACAGDSAVEATLDQLEDDLATTFVVDGAGRAGIEGAAESIVVRARGVQSGESMSEETGCEFRFDAGSGALQGKRLGLGGPETTVGRLARVRWRYWDQGEWRETFNSAAAGRLPSLVEVRVWFSGAEGEEEEAWGRADRTRVIVVPDAGETGAG